MKITQKGYIFEIFVYFWLAVFALVFVCMANGYFTEAGVFKELQGTCPGVKKVVRVERNWFAKSVITVETYDNARVVYFLDSDVLFNYDLKIR